MNCRTLLLAVLAMAFTLCARAQMVVGPWIPIFKGVDRAVGTNFPDATIPRLQVVNCVRVDLQDPDVQLFTTPRATNYIAENTETQTLTVSNFLKRHNLKVAINANFYWSFCCGGSDPNAENVSATTYGLFVSTGQAVSVPDNPPPNDSIPRGASWMFTSNKEPIFVYKNYPPTTNTTNINGTNIYTAVSGYYPVLSNDVNIGDAAITDYPDSSYHNAQPRTSFGMSENRRYLFLMTIDGRQNSYSQGAVDRETAAWLSQFGASDGITMDGGGSTSMYMADCAGNPTPLNHSSYVVQYNRERNVGAHLGIQAKALDAFVSDVAATPGSTTATITWNTASNATSQVEYGPTPSLGTLSPIDSTPVTNHGVVLGGLAPATRYYFRVLSVADGTQHASTCAANSFTTTNFAGGVVFGLSQNWRYSTDNLDGFNWQAAGFDDSAWPNGPGPMWADSRTPPQSNGPNVPNGGTRMPVDPFTTYSYVTYYLRTYFVYTNPLSGVTLTFSNYVDDGAIVYLNGFELFRTNMNPGPVFNSTTAPFNACLNNSATCPWVISFTGSALSNLVAGTNVVAVEVHNIQVTSPDAVFQAALFYSLPPPPPPYITNVVVGPGETTATITWTTLSNSTSQVMYGVTPALGSATALDTNRVMNHAVVLTGLEPKTLYYFRLISSDDLNQHLYNGTFSTTTLLVPLVTFSNVWRFSTNNLSGVNWAATNYDDSAWTGQGPALLYIENSSDVIPRNTALPGGVIFPTYYFRTHFSVGSSMSGLSLLFSNYIDDGAVFYLNGAEIQRVRMPGLPVPLAYPTLATSCAPSSCDATFEAPDIFRVSGSVLTNVIIGDNVLAAEVHQATTNDSDVVFGSAVALVRAAAAETPLRIARNGDVVCVSWTGQFLTLQRASVLGGSNSWADVPGPVNTSPYCSTNPGTTFYRLKN